MNWNLISLLGQQAALLFIHHPSLAPAHQWLLLIQTRSWEKWLHFSVSAKSIVHSWIKPSHPSIKQDFQATGSACSRTIQQCIPGVQRGRAAVKRMINSSFTFICLRRRKDIPVVHITCKGIRLHTPNLPRAELTPNPAPFSPVRTPWSHLNCLMLEKDYKPLGEGFL